ncbi:MAG TPA: RDD family protein [Candidatus Limnocylindrales bacterium]|nr:RDD family protein [Candidatus Limnocylindrales bacterium]
MTISPGWYKDPADPSTQRYWDGEGWIGAPLPVDVTPPTDTPVPLPQPAAQPQPKPEGEPKRKPVTVEEPPAATRPPWAPAVPLTEPVKPHGFVLANPGARLAARIIDIGAVLLLNIVVNSYFVYLFVIDFVPYSRSVMSAYVRGDTEYPQAPERLSTLLIVITLLAMALWFAYEVPATANSGQTLGKRLYSIKVVRVENLEPLGFLRAWRRWNPLGGPLLLFAFICCAPFAILLQALDVMFVLLDRMQRMALHDRSAGTYVVQLPKTGRASGRKGKR